MPDIRIELLPANQRTLSEYSSIPISFEVRSILRVDLVDGGLGGIRLKEEPVARPYIKDYDARDGEGPTRWLKRFDVANWRLFIARDGERAIGGATVVINSPEIHSLNGRDDLCIIWDLRLCPEFRRKGIGTGLFNAVSRWARDRGCSQMAVETQNNNVPACRFYARQGCTLGEINRYHYIQHRSFADEVMLVWYLDLARKSD